MHLLWAFRVAMRDARHSLLTLAMLIVSIVIGIAAVVALSGFKETIAAEISRQVRSLVGADLVVGARSRFSLEAEAVLDRFEGRRARELTFASMAYFPKGEGSRLVQVNAVSSGFPLYGTLQTEPLEASREFFEGADALVDKSLLLQFGASVGDFVRLGAKEFRVAGVLRKVPGVVETRNLIAPRIYIPLRYLDETELIRRGSRVRSKEYFRFARPGTAEMIAASYKQVFSEHYLSAETAGDREQELTRITGTVAEYLGFTAFIALVLGGLGVGGAAHLYIRRKRGAIAVLRCLGASSWQTMLVFVMQISVFGALGILCGLGFGILLQAALPAFVGDLLPVSAGYRWSLRPLAAGAGIGALMLLLFSAIPVMRSRLVSPLAALRMEVGEEERRDPLAAAAWALLLAGTVLCASLISGSLRVGLLYSGIVLAALAAFAVLGTLLVRLLSRRALRKGPYAWRQGLANLHRPHNQTRTLVVLIGMGIFLLVLISFSRELVLKRIRTAGSMHEPNIIAFDIQADQRRQMREFAEQHGLEIVEDVPIVSMRLASVNGRPVRELFSEPGYERWTLARTYRSTYSSELRDTEELATGRFVPNVGADVSPVPVTLSKRISERLKASLGDRLSFDVQGVTIETEVVGIRTVDWQRLRPNFFVVFPEGVLEEAPQFFVLAARASSEEDSARFQRAAVQQFPNVSIIDLRLVQQTVDEVLDRLGQAVKFLGLLSMATAAIVLLGAVLNTKDQRAREYALLKVLGSSRRTILIITAMEYGILGFLAAVLGVGFSALGAAALGWYVFSEPLVIPPAAAWLTAGGLVLCCMLIGLLASAGTYRSSPADLLRV